MDEYVAVTPTPPALEVARDFEQFVKDARTIRIVDAWKFVQDIRNGVITSLPAAVSQANALNDGYFDKLAEATDVLAADSSLDFLRLS